MNVEEDLIYLNQTHVKNKKEMMMMTKIVDCFKHPNLNANMISLTNCKYDMIE